MKTNIWWIRRDLRLFDYLALSTTINNGNQIGKEYPFPIVDLIKSRYRALNAFVN